MVTLVLCAPSVFVWMVELEDAIHGYWPNRKGALTLSCVGVFLHLAFYQACFQLLPPLARTFTLTNNGSIEHAPGSNP